MLEPDARAGPPVDPDALLALKRDFDVENHIAIDESIPGLLRVGLKHGSGRCAWPDTPAQLSVTPLALAHSRRSPRPASSRADVCLRGATVTSWQIVNGSEVLYIRPDTALEEGQPIRHASHTCAPTCQFCAQLLMRRAFPCSQWRHSDSLPAGAQRQPATGEVTRRSSRPRLCGCARLGAPRNGASGMAYPLRRGTGRYQS
jgi:hypothetical protein